MRPHVAQTTPEGVQADVAAAVVSAFDGRARRAASSPSASASAGRHRGVNRRVATTWRDDRLLRAPGSTRIARANAARRRDRRSDPGAPGGQRREDPGRGLPNVEFDEALTAAGSSTRSSLTRERRTASSTAATRSSRTNPPTPGSGYSTSSSATAPASAAPSTRGRSGRRRSLARRRPRLDPQRRSEVTSQNGWTASARHVASRVSQSSALSAPVPIAPSGAAPSNTITGRCPRSPAQRCASSTSSSSGMFGHSERWTFRASIRTLMGTSWLTP